MTTDSQVSPRRNTTLIKIGLAAGTFALIGLVALIGFGGSNGRTATDATGDPAPAITLDYLDGTQAELSDLTGTPVMINFFADWCPACVAEMPDLEVINQEFGDDLIIVGIDQSTSDAGLQQLLADTGITYAVALDRDGQIYAAFGGLSMPTSVFLYPDGSVARVHSGVTFEDQLRDILNDLFFTG